MKCLLEAAAFLTEIPAEKIIEEIGHDGSEIWFPSNSEPNNRRGFNIQEFVDFFFRRNVAMIEIVAGPVISENDIDPPRQLFESNFEEQRLQYYMQFPGILVGRTSVRPFLHACAWTGKRAVDNGRFYESHELPLNIDYFYPLLRIKSPLDNS